MNDQPTRKLEVGTKVFLQDPDGKFLFLKRSRPYEGEDFCRWDIPGGRIIPGETQTEALQREVFEETGLKLQKTDDVLGVQDILRIKSKHIVRITYLAIVTDQTNVRLNAAEHTDYAWLSLDELSKITYDLFLKPIIEILKNKS